MTKVVLLLVMLMLVAVVAAIVMQGVMVMLQVVLVCQATVAVAVAWAVLDHLATAVAAVEYHQAEGVPMPNTTKAGHTKTAM